MKYHHTLRRLFFISPIAALFTTTALHGQTNGTWDGGGNNSIWGGFANWDPNGVIATGAGGTATFASAFGNGRTIFLNGSRTLGNVVYTDPDDDETAMTLAWLSNQAAATLTLNAQANSPFFDVTQPDRTLTVTARIGGANGFTKIGPGAMILDIPGSAPNHPISGSIVISEGILSLAEGGVLANATLDTTNSVIGDETNGLRVEVAELTLGGLSGDKDFASVFTTTDGGYDGVTSLTLNPTSSAGTIYTGAITDGSLNMSLFKVGPMTQVVLGAHSYTGTTTIGGGALILSTASSGSAGINTAEGTTLGVMVVEDEGKCPSQAILPSATKAPSP